MTRSGGKIVVAIDGPAGSGKSTVAKRVAEALGFLYIDTGAMYRAVGWRALADGVALDDAPRLERLAREARIELQSSPPRVWLNGREVTAAIRSPEVSDAASRVSAIPGVRRALVEKQRQMAAERSVVMEGRDIGSVVFPQAEVKIFLDADPAVRAERRLRDLRARGETPSLAEMVRELEQRDRRDRTRADSPLVQAPDAIHVDTTRLSIEQVEQIILRVVRARTANGKESAP